MKLNLTAPSQTHRILVYGPPKTGKTQLVGELANHGYNLLWFDLENGSGTLRKLPVESQERINLIALPDTRSFPIGIETCLKVIKGTKVSICQNHGKISCAICAKESAPVETVELNSLGTDSIVVFDSLTQLTNSCIAHITKGKPDDYSLEYADWGNLGKLLDVFLSHVQQLGCHVICISHETESQLEDGKVRIVPTAGTRNFSRNSAKYFDHVIYTEVKNKKHGFSSMTTSQMNIVVGSRTDVDMTGKDSLIEIFRAPKPAEAVKPSDTAVANLQAIKVNLLAKKG